MKRFFAGVVVAAALSVFVVTLWGLYLPEISETTARRSIDATAGAVWTVMNDPEDRARWWGEVERIARIDESDPARLEWHEYYADGGSRAFRRTNYFPPRAQAFIASTQFGAVDEWVIQVLPGKDGTRVALTQSRTVKNPALRFFHHYFAKPKQTGEAMLEALDAQMDR